MNNHDKRNKFPGDLCAQLITGAYDTPTYKAAINDLRAAYQIALNYYKLIMDSDKENRFITRLPLQADAIQSEKMMMCERLLENDKGSMFAGWLTYGKTDFDSQLFERDEICRWLTAVGLKSVYSFGTAPAQTAEPAPVAESTSVFVQKQRTQENRILQLLTAQGYDPLKLAPRAPGKPGPKAEIKTLALKENKLFSKNSFDKAWERLRNDGAVAGAK